jgi:hypothetical protein
MGRYVALDLGATSGRVTAGRLERGRLDVREVHRFANRPVEALDELRDVVRRSERVARYEPESSRVG